VSTAESKRRRACCGEPLYKLSVLAEQAVQPEINSSREQADKQDDQQRFPLRDFSRLGYRPRLSSGYYDTWREHSLERFVIQVSIVHGHFSGMIELGVVHNDLRLQFCSQSRSRMKRGRLMDGAIVRDPDHDRHLVTTGILVAIELDLGSGSRAHKTRESNYAAEFRNYFS
jgi:hypothetical protein